MHTIYKNQIDSVQALLGSGANVNRAGNYESDPRTMRRRVTPLGTTS